MQPTKCLSLHSQASAQKEQAQTECALPWTQALVRALSTSGVCAQSLQLCLALCDPLDCNQPGLSVHGILQARMLEWVALLQEVSLNPGLNQHLLCLLHCRQVLYMPSHHPEPPLHPSHKLFRLLPCSLQNYESLHW